MSIPRLAVPVLGVVAAVALVVAGVSSASASTTSPVLSVAPAYPDPTVPTGASYFVHSVVPGGTWASEVAVVNTTGAAVTAWVDPVDGITSIRTGAVYASRTVARAGAALWITPSVSTIRVGALSRATVGFIVRVPKDASAGDHVGGIAFETQSPGSPSAQPSGGTVVTTVLRSVVAVQVVVPGPASFQLHLYGASVRAVASTGTSGLDIDMADVGGLIGRPHLTIILSGPSGYSRSLAVQLDTMLPGDRITDEFLWPDALPAGDYRVSITEDGGGRQGIPFLAVSHLGSALRPLVPGPSAVAPIAAPSRMSTAPPVVVAAAVTCASAIALAVAVVMLRRRRQVCLHCQRAVVRRRLVSINGLDEIGGCTGCAVRVQNSGVGRLCHACLRSHLRPYKKRVSPHSGVETGRSDPGEL